MQYNKILDLILEIFRIFKPNIRNWIVKILIVSGITIITPSIWGPIVEIFLIEIGINISIKFTEYPGWILLGLGLVVYMFNIYSEKQSKKEPRFTEDIDKLSFSFGEHGITCIYSIDELRHTPKEPFNFGQHIPIKVYLDGNRNNLYADVEVFSQNNIPPIKIKKNKLSGVPVNWDSNKSDNAIEIVDENENPMYQFIYKNGGHIIVNGIFPYPGGLVVADTNGMLINPTLPAQLNLQRIFKYPSWKYPAVYEN